MKVLKEHRKRGIVTCEECGSVIELETDGEIWDWHAGTMQCPVCKGHKVRNV